MNLFLIGPRGVGKTTAGAIAAKHLGVPFIDTDQQIIEKTSMSIGQIFSTKGETFFRSLEEKILAEIFNQNHQVVSTGGGSILIPSIQNLLAEYPGVLHLTANNHIIRRRIKDTDRPALLGINALDEIEELMKIRGPIYKRLAKQTINTDSLSIEDVANVIQHFWTKLTSHNLR